MCKPCFALQTLSGFREAFTIEGGGISHHNILWVCDFALCLCGYYTVEVHTDGIPKPKTCSQQCCGMLFQLCWDDCLCHRGLKSQEWRQISGFINAGCCTALCRLGVGGDFQAVDKITSPISFRCKTAGLALIPPLTLPWPFADGQAPARKFPIQCL